MTYAVLSNISARHVKQGIDDQLFLIQNKIILLASFGIWEHSNGYNTVTIRPIYGHYIRPYRGRIVVVYWPYRGRIVAISWPYRGHCYPLNFPFSWQITPMF